MRGDRVVELAVIGLGAWGLCVVERAVSVARSSGTHVVLHVIEPNEIGGVPYGKDQLDYLVLNNACGQLSLFASSDVAYRPSYALGLWEWAVEIGYRWIDGRCVVGKGGAPIVPTDYLPRRLMGEYLAWCYQRVSADAPPNVTVRLHRSAAVDVQACSDGRERVVLDDGDTLVVQHVTITSGHTANRTDTSGPLSGRYMDAYPVSALNERVTPHDPVAVAGMGLVAYDIVAALTEGRGGRFVETGRRMTYRASGQEPSIVLYSRSGVPFCAKAANGIDSTGLYQPVICTPELFAGLRAPSESSVKREVDFRAEVLPLVFLEMQARFQIQSAVLRDGAAAGEAVSSELRRAWREGSALDVFDRLSRIYGQFDPADQLFSDLGADFDSAEDYQRHVYDFVEADLAEALVLDGSPVKAAQEVIRVLRDDLRSVIDFGGLSLTSYLDFKHHVKGRINRIEAGPPPMRSKQLLALMDAGVVRADLGPSPDLDVDGSCGVTLRSTRLAHGHHVGTTRLVRGHLSMPSLEHTASPLLSALHDRGRLTPMRYGDVGVGSVALTPDNHPVDRTGKSQENISLFGVLTEGTRYFTHYLPSPRSRIRAVLDAQACMEAALL
ncbi:FAD/NAD(P)-binding protein [Flexivirga alba]|uniref:FAD/NAD(P)-binding protein n=1 Tax=Flexivirga alba TaxID=702742 RepID=A0ABW2AFN3_9MICO